MGERVFILKFDELQKQQRVNNIICPKKSYIMEQQKDTKQKQLVQLPDDFQILHLIETTYQSKNNAQISSAQAILNGLLGVDKFIQKLFHLLQIQQQQSVGQFKLAVSILIKKFSYQYSKKQNTSKLMFVQKLYCLLISKLNIKSKQQLGTALEYVLNHDQGHVYQPKVMEKVAQLLQAQPDNFVLQGSLIISISCLNSLIEAQDQLNFIWKILDSLIKHAVNILQILMKQPVENLVMQDSKKMLKLSKKIFDLLQMTFSRALDQEEFISQKIDQLRNYAGLQTLFFSYLANFGYTKSILSTVPQINSVKQIVVQIIFTLYHTQPMPQNIFNLFFITMLLQAERQSYEQEEQHIISRVLELLQKYLEDKFYLQTFEDHKMQILMSMFTYSITKPQQFDMLEDQPQKFVQLSEQYTEGFKDSTLIKVRAASFLRLFASKFDGALRNILQVVVIVITANMQYEDPNSPCLQLYLNLQSQFPQFKFFKVDPSLQLQTCFNILSLLSIYITKRQDLNKIVYAILVTHFSKIVNVQKPIVLLRLIRLIGYYPTAVYYDMIKMKMSLGKVFVLQGLKSFQRILKVNRYPQIFQVLAQIFSELINVMNINDTIFESIVLNHYQRILKKNLSLYNNFLIKIRDTFIENIQKSQHFSFMCLSYLYSMLNKENQSSFRGKIMQYFYSIEEYYNKVRQFYQQKVEQNTDSAAALKSNKQILKNIQNYEQKVVDIYSVLVKKQATMSPRMVQFSIKQLNNLGNKNKNDQIFRLYNNLFLKIDSDSQQIMVYYNGFMREIRGMFTPLMDQGKQPSTNWNHNQKLQILPNLSYLVSQLFASFYEVHLHEDDLGWMLKILGSVTQDVKQYILLMILSYTYVQPVKLKKILQSQNLYEQTLKFLLTTSYNQKLIRKTFLLAMSKLLQIQQDYFEDIIRQCIKYFKQQFTKNQTKRKRVEHVDPKLRRMLHQGYNQDQQQMVAQKGKQQSSAFPHFKHPFSSLSQYDQFKIRVWQNIKVVERLNEHDKNQLREILQMDWFGKGVRRILNVKQPPGVFD